MDNCTYKIYDNENEEWTGVGFADFEDAEYYVMHDLGDADMEIYSIYNLICGR